MDGASDLALWLCNNYRQTPTAVRPVRFLDVYMYYEDHCKQTQKTQQSKDYVTRVIPKIFPDCVRTVVYQNGKRYHGFGGLSRVDVLEETTAKYIYDDGVHMTKDKDTIKLLHQTTHLLGGSSVIIDMTIEKDKLNIKVNKHAIERTSLDLPEQVKPTQTNVVSLIHISKHLHICRGTLVSESNEGTGRLEKWSTFFNSTVENRHRSKKCAGVVPWLSKSDTCVHCFMSLKCIRAKQKKHDSYDTSSMKCVAPLNEDNAVALDNIDPFIEGATVTRCNTDSNAPLIEATTTSRDETERPELINMAEEDHVQLKAILQQNLIKGAPEEFRVLMESQLKNLNAEKDHRYRRWDKRVIGICLSMYCRSPQAYADLKSSGMLVLPSKRLLQYYKNSVAQKPGLNENQLVWMQKEAEAANVTSFGRRGGIIIDEMTIQDDIQIVRKGNAWTIVGMLDMGDVCNDVDTIIDEKASIKMATHVLQVVFHGFTGFRWPVAYFASAPATTHQLYLTFWECVERLEEKGFLVDYLMMDGGSANRALTSILIPSDPRREKYSTKHVYDFNRNIAIIQDVKHCLKKIRNGIESSRLSHMNAKGRLLEVNGKQIVWDHFEEAFGFNTQAGFRIHRKLRKEHIELTPSSKMRNELATSVLNDEMWFLMRSYQATIKDPERLSGTIELLDSTRDIVRIFEDRNRPITKNDPRIQQLQDCLAFFNAWESSVQGSVTLTERKHLLTKECRDDLNSCILGFCALCDEILTGVGSINPGYFNSDLIENVFCQERGIHHGCNTNPTLNQYGPAINAICLGQTTISNKSNSGINAHFFHATTPGKLVNL